MRQGDHAAIPVGTGGGLLSHVKSSEGGGPGWVGERRAGRAESLGCEAGERRGTRPVSLVHFCPWDWVEGVVVPEGELGKRSGLEEG